MTPEQEKIAETLIAEMKHKKGTINWKPFRDENSIDGMDMTIVIKALRELEIIENFQGDTTVIRLTERNGWTFPGFEAQRHMMQSQKNLNEQKDKYDFLTKRFIYKARFVPYIISGLALAVSIFAYFKPEKKPQDLQPMQQEIQELQYRVKQLDSLLQADTLPKKRK